VRGQAAARCGARLRRQVVAAQPLRCTLCRACSDVAELETELRARARSLEIENAAALVRDRLAQTNYERLVEGDGLPVCNLESDPKGESSKLQPKFPLNLLIFEDRDGGQYFVIAA
jgi:hypothetical protein